jgi:hypothetical protein
MNSIITKRVYWGQESFFYVMSDLFYIKGILLQENSMQFQVPLIPIQVFFLYMYVIIKSVLKINFIILVILLAVCSELKKLETQHLLFKIIVM